VRELGQYFSVEIATFLKKDSGKKREIWGQFHQHSTYSFYARGAQIHKKDSQVVSLFTLLESAGTKAASCV
jgi:hypothetical protein